MRGVAAAVAGLALLVAVTGCSLGGGDSSSSSSSSSTSPSAPVSTGARTAPPSRTAGGTTTAAGAATTAAARTPVAPASTAEKAAAAAQATRSGYTVASADVSRLVPGGPATGGYSLWSATAEGRLLTVILGPDHRGLSWSGCSREFAGAIDRCGGVAVLPSTLLLGGHVAPTVASVDVITRSGARLPAAVGAGGWLYHTATLNLKDPKDPANPATAEARDASGKVLGSVPLAR